MLRPGTSDVLPLLVASIVAFGALGACSDATDPADDPLADLHEMAIWTAMGEELVLFNHSAEANANLRLALGSAIPLAAPLPAELFGNTMVYDPGTDTWTAEPLPTVPDNTLRVIWYQVSGAFVAVPIAEHGFIDLIDRGDPELTRLDVRAVRTDNGPTTLADYTARFGETAGATTRDRVFEAAGMVSDGERQLSFDTRDTETETLGTGETTTTTRLDLSASGFGYHAVLGERSSSQNGETEVTLVARVTVAGVESRVELALNDIPNGSVTGHGAVFHGGQKLADVAVSGTVASPQWTFTRPDGSAYTRNQHTRLGDLISILLTPLATSANYFS